MTWEVWLSFAIVAVAATATPGPGNLSTLRRAVELGRRPALFCMLGNVAGLAILGAATGLGIVAVLATSPDIWFAFQWLAIGFLIFLSIQMMIKNRPPSGASQPGLPTMAFRLFGESFVVSLRNPKAAVFFLAVFPLFVDPNLSPAKQSALIVLTCMTISAIVYDNDSCLVAKIEADGRRRRTQMFTEMLSHYLFGDRYGRPGTGNDKGNV